MGATSKFNFRSKGAVLIAVAAWFGLLAFGFVSLIVFQTTPGEAGHSPEHWPVDSVIQKSNTTPTLVVFASSSCSCSRATLEELARTLSRVRRDVRVELVASASSAAGEALLDIDTKTYSNMQVRIDADGTEAKRFGILTSGHTLLYAESGELLFNGGITSGRGHRGDNEGEDALVALIDGASTTPVHMPVFGCHFLEESA